MSSLAAVHPVAGPADWAFAGMNLTLRGWRTFDAAVFCAAVAAGQRYLLGPPVAQSEERPALPVTPDLSAQAQYRSRDTGSEHAERPGQSQPPAERQVPSAQCFLPSPQPVQAASFDSPPEKVEEFPMGPDAAAGSDGPPRTRRKVGIASATVMP
jgi:hypothetical protein